MNIYFDNAATTFPKPKEVADAMVDYMINGGGNAGRGSSSAALESSRNIFECREAIAQFFNFPKSQNVIFTNNITTSLNTLLMGCVKKGWHVITSSMEHNSVLRPLIKLEDEGIITLDIIQCNSLGKISIDDIQKIINKDTKLMIFSHASNIIGTIQPLEEIGSLCKRNNIYFIIDSAQTAGVLDLDFQKLNCNALAFTGHKGLMGPQGIGGFIIDDELNSIAKPFIVGGTGSLSHSLHQPDYLPDKFESGTLNIPGIIGLKAAIKFINNVGLDSIKEKEDDLSQYLLNKLSYIDSIKIYGLTKAEGRTATFSFNFKNIDPSEASFILDNQYGFINRTGLHCAPLAHKTIGTFPEGTIRISLGYFNTYTEIDKFIDAVNSIKGGF